MNKEKKKNETLRGVSLEIRKRYEKRHKICLKETKRCG